MGDVWIVVAHVEAYTASWIEIGNVNVPANKNNRRGLYSLVD